MNCELCGKEIGKPREVMIEGSRLQVCEECAQYGKEVISESSEDATSNEIMQRIEKKKRERESRMAYDDKNVELAIDYPEKINKARLDKDWTQEDLAKKINEKRSVIAKLEKADMRPSEELRKKLERTLDIDLMEQIEEVQMTETEESGGMTIGDLIEGEE